MAEALLYAKAKMGEILKFQSSREGTLKTGEHGSQKSLPTGISHKQSHFAQKLYENEGLIEKVIEEAEVLQILFIFTFTLKGDQR